jgi:hypothetical protein
VADQSNASRKTSTDPGRPALVQNTAAYAVTTDLHLLDRLAVLYRYRAVAAMVFVLTTLAVVIQSYPGVRRAGPAPHRGRADGFSRPGAHHRAGVLPGS